MSISLAREQVVRFLSTADPEVLCIRGLWGVGKTFTWNTILKEEKARVALPRYAYVSLFGVNNLDGFRKAIFENTIDRSSIGEPASLTTVADNIKKQALPAIQAMGRLPLVGGFFAAASALEPYLSLLTTGQIICIDDLERVGKGLEIREVLGLVSFLREQRRCKVVILANTDALAPEQESQFNQYQEKVVDRIIAFEPSPSECAKIALASDPYELAEKCVKLGISNIRVIKKIELAVKQARTELAELDPAVLNQAAHSLTLFGWVAWSRDAPEFDFLVSRRQNQFLAAVEGQPKTDARSAAWNSLLDEYGFAGVDQFDLVLREGLLNGYFNSAKLKEEGARVQRAFRAEEAQAARKKAWAIFHDSFDNNGAAFLDALFVSVVSNVEFFEAGSIDESIEIMRQFGRTESADAIIARYVEFHGDNLAAFDVQSFRGWHQLKDAKFIETLERKFLELMGAQTPIDAILRRGSGRSRRGDLQVAARVTEDELLAAFKTLRGEELRDLLHACLSSDRVVNADLRERDIANKAKRALRRIGEEGGVNAIRIGRYGSLDPVESGREEQRGEDY